MKKPQRLFQASAMILSAVILAASCQSSFKVYDLVCEGLSEPLGIDSAEPHFSWKISSSQPMEQVAYEIQVASSRKDLLSGKAGLWSSGKVISSDQVMVPYAGSPLSSRQMCWWRVRVWKSDGNPCKWSEPRRFGIGIIGGDTLRGDYIGAIPGENKDPVLRGELEITKLPEEAILYVNSLGYHEAFINGVPVSSSVLNPAVSQLDKRSLIVAYDVSRLLKKGRNEILILAASGWYGVFADSYKGPLVKAELDAVTPEGQETLLCTGPSWTGAWSGYSETNPWRGGQFGGEILDASRISSLFSSGTDEDFGWGPVDVVNVTGPEATPQMCELCFPVETVTARSIEPAGDGRWIVDFGRVINGMLDLSMPALPKGHVFTASFSDYMEKDGSVTAIEGVNKYVASGNASGDRFADKFNHHVFRYVVLDSLPEAPSAGDIKALRMRTGFKPASTFESSDEEIDAIHDMIHYTLENLAFNGYMVDCANIERLGYGGDGNASTLTLQTMFDVAPLYTNWLNAWNDVIQEDGGLPHTAPCPWRAGGGPYWCGFIVQAPWRTYMSYADKRLMERCYPTMTHWLEYVDAYTVDGLLRNWPDTQYRTWYLGDWAAPTGVDVTDPESVLLVNNCSLCQVYQDLERIAVLVGHAEDAASYKARYEALAARINETLYHPEDHVYASGSQIDMVYPMLVGIVPEAELGQVRDKLMERTATVYEDHLKTGLVGVPVITEWATLAKEVDFMYGMLKQHGYPGYLYMIDNGATATWEHWNAHRSRLHNCFNGIGSWFYQALGGIIPDEPGYRHVTIDPQVPQGLERVKVTKETPYGQILVSREGNSLHFELPVGVKATVAGKEYSCGKHDVVL